MKKVGIVGSGIIGLATAYKLKKKRPDIELVIFEKEESVGLHQTGNNSGVLHSGIYYKPNSLKAKLCQEGYSQMLSFCKTYNIDYELCGKLIVATDKSELESLDKIFFRGKENGLLDLQMLSESEIKQKEPNINGIKAIWVPQAGIVKYKKVCEKLYELLLREKVKFNFNSQVKSITYSDESAYISTEETKHPFDVVINCAGLYSDVLAKENQEKLDIRIIPFRGEYYNLIESKSDLINHLIYPVPDLRFPFLGVHLTKKMDGRVEVGPNAVLAFRREGYRWRDFNFSEFLLTVFWPGFHKLIQKHWKYGLSEMYRSLVKKKFVKTTQKLLSVRLKDTDLMKGGAGVRAQAILRNGELVDDFFILEKGCIINVLNTPSPAATSSLSIGDHIVDLILNKKSVGK